MQNNKKVADFARIYDPIKNNSKPHNNIKPGAGNLENKAFKKHVLNLAMQPVWESLSHEQAHFLLKVSGLFEADQLPLYLANAYLAHKRQKHQKGGTNGA